ELGAEVSTLIPPGAVDPVSGDFDAAEHGFTINEGTLSGEVAVLFNPREDVQFDFATEPVEGMGSGTGNLNLVERARDSDSVSYNVTVLLPVAVMEVVTAGGLDVEVTAEGTIKAAGVTTVPLGPEDPFGSWAEDNDIPGAPFEGDENNDGVPNGLVWALGLDAGTPPFPFLLQPARETGEIVSFSITLPPGGSAGEILVRGSADPGVIPFSDLPPDAVSRGNPIPVGTSGTVTIELPPGGQGFVQLQVTAPVP
ncbi:MAG: hypothetical protein GWO24_05165, partial [Akkermansiaceae bacterium]|nr:hypothetical protein [Akkermansiaceae bacterium]